jgi:hypothetical protein
MTERRWWEPYKVTVPEGEAGCTVVERFTIADAHNLTNMRLAMSGMRTVPEGTWARIYSGGTLWMSDTPSEIIDHMEPIKKAEKIGGRVLVNGLGIGVVLQAVLRASAVERVDVVEIAADVIALVAPHYEQMARELGVELVIHEADALTIQWPRGTTFDVAWHDIWPGICTDNIETMGTLHRKYGRRARWQGSWRRESVLAQKRRERAQGWW